MAAKKTTCPVSRAEFREKAEPVNITIGGKIATQDKDGEAVEVTLGGQRFTADVKEFSTGSLGWYLNSKANVRIGDRMVSVQIGLNLTVVGSKELPMDSVPSSQAAAERSRDNMAAEGPGE